MDRTSKAGWLSRPCLQEDQHGRWVPGEGPLISLSLGVAGQASPFEGWAGTLLISGGEEGTPGRGGPWPAGEHPTVSGSASFPEKAGAGFMLKDLWSPVHHLPWVLFS